MIRFLEVRISISQDKSSISSDLYEEGFKLNKSSTNRIIQIVPCKTTLIKKRVISKISHFTTFVKNNLSGQEIGTKLFILIY